MKSLFISYLTLVIPFITPENQISSGIKMNSGLISDSLEISRSRADFLISKLPKADPWDARPDGSSLA